MTNKLDLPAGKYLINGIPWTISDKRAHTGDPVEQNINQLTPGETERLALLMEECAEVQHIGCKVLRHGYESKHPFKGADTNRMMLEVELGHLLHAIDRIRIDTHWGRIQAARVLKSHEVVKYLHHQPHCNLPKGVDPAFGTLLNAVRDVCESGIEALPKLRIAFAEYDKQKSML